MKNSLYKAINYAEWITGNLFSPILDGQPCYGGLELGWSDDLAAWVLVFPAKDADGEVTYYVKCAAWIPRGTKHNLYRDPFATFIKHGCLTVTETETTDHAAIRDQIVDDSKRYRVQSIAADRFGARMMLDGLTNDHGINTFGFTQNANHYDRPYYLLSKAIADRRLIHSKELLLTWCANGAVVQRNNLGLFTPAKMASRTKIEAFTALLMAFSECLFGEATAEPKSTATNIPTIIPGCSSLLVNQTTIGRRA